MDAGRAVEDVDGRPFGCPLFQVISEQALGASMNTTGFGTAVVPLTEWPDSELVPGRKPGWVIRLILGAELCPTETFDMLGLLDLWAPKE